MPPLKFNESVEIEPFVFRPSVILISIDLCLLKVSLSVYVCEWRIDGFSYVDRNNQFKYALYDLYENT